MCFLPCKQSKFTDGDIISEHFPVSVLNQIDLHHLKGVLAFNDVICLISDFFFSF